MASLGKPERAPHRRVVWSHICLYVYVLSYKYALLKITEGSYIMAKMIQVPQRVGREQSTTSESVAMTETTIDISLQWLR